MCLKRILQIISVFIFCKYTFAGKVNSSIDNLYYFGGSFTSNNSTYATGIWSNFLSSRYNKVSQWKRSNYALARGASIHLTPQRRSGVNNQLGHTYPAYFQNIDAGVVPAISANDIHLTYVGPNDFVAFRVPYLNDHYQAYLELRRDLLFGFGIDIDVEQNPDNIRDVIAAVDANLTNDIMPVGVTGNPGNVALDALGPTLSQLMDKRVALINQHVTELVARGSKANVVFTHHDITNNYHAIEWNKKLISSISGINSNIVIFDYFRFVREVVADENNIIPNDNPDNRNHGTSDTVNGKFFPNTLGTHPSPGAHQITASALASILEAAYFVPEITHMTLENGNRHINQVLLSNNMNLPTRGLFFSVLGMNKFSHDVTSKGHNIGYSSPNKLSGGVNAMYVLNQSLCFGLQLSAYRNELAMPAVMINARQREYMVSVSSKIHINKIVQINGILGLGIVKYDVNRQIPFGLQTRSEIGSSSNTRLLGALRASFPLQTSLVSIAPYVDISYQNTGKLSYTENGEVRSTRMQFVIASRESVKIGMGAILSTKSYFGRFSLKPFLQLGITQELKGGLSVSKRQAKVSDIDNTFHAFDVYGLPKNHRTTGVIATGLSLSKKIISTNISYQVFLNQGNSAHQLSLDFTVKVI